MAEINPYVKELFGLANVLAVPLTQKLTGSQTSSQTTATMADRMLQEQVQQSMLNGSGPNDPAAAVESAPTSLFDFITGKSVVGGKVQQGIPWLLIGLGALLIFLVMRR